MPTPGSPTPDLRAPLALIGLCLALGVLPYLGIMDHLPWGSDATKWVSDGSLDNARWPQWVLATKHFVGWRPVAAVSFVANHATTGYEPAGYRITDVALHVATGALLVALYRSWTGHPWPWGLVAAAVYFCHPVVEEIVPYCARRSYTLASTFGLAGLLTLTEAYRRERPWVWVIVGTALSALAWMSNEVAYVMLALTPLLAWHFRPQQVGLGRLALRLVPTWAIAAILLSWRYHVLGFVGGYSKKYFAFVRNGRVLLKQVVEESWLDIAQAAWSYLCFPTSVTGDAALWLASGAGAAAVGTIAAYFGWRLLVEPIRGGNDPGLRLRALLVVWALGYSGMFALAGTWFWRQGHHMVLPLAVAMAMLAHDGFRQAQGRPLHLALHGVPQVLLAASLLWHSPVTRGLAQAPLQGRELGTEMVYELTRQVRERELKGPAQVYLVLPIRKGKAHMVRIWARRHTQDRTLAFPVLAGQTGNGKRSEASAQVKELDGRLRLVLPEAAMEWTQARHGRARLQGTTRVWLDQLGDGKTPSWVFVAAPDGSSQLVRCPQPPPGVVPAEGEVPASEEDPDAPPPRRRRGRRSRAKRPPPAP